MTELMDLDILLETTARALACVANAEADDIEEQEKDRQALRNYRKSLYDLDNEKIDTDKGIEFLNTFFNKYDLT